MILLRHMSNHFKITTATVFLILTFILSSFAFFSVSLMSFLGTTCVDLICRYVLIFGFLEAVSVIFYVMFLGFKKDVYFWLTIATSLVAFLTFFVPMTFK